jgi:hypothetical protein
MILCSLIVLEDAKEQKSNELPDVTSATSQSMAYSLDMTGGGWRTQLLIEQEALNHMSDKIGISCGRVMLTSCHF